MLPFILKVIEKSIHDQTQDSLQRGELIRANHSTDTCLSQLTDT